MRRVSVIAAVLALAAGVAAGAQAPEAAPRQARAARVAPGDIVLDGILDDDAWTKASPIGDFIQKDPVEGAPPSDAIVVLFAYDDTALYVGARMSSAHASIQAPLGRRDDQGQSEYLLVALDTYLDRRTAYGFGVTAAGVRIDRYYPADSDDFDAEIDPVWQARTHVEAGGWTAEMWIPLSQLRFNLREEQVWGLNVQRFVPSINESDYWVEVPRTVKAWASRFGELRGIDQVRPPRRLELLPYVAGSSTLTGRRDPRNPFDDGKNLVGRAGADLKIGFGSNLTLDATVNPDFGQVEADPAEVNLSAFETFFPEKRPFFTEGSGLINSRTEAYFYSRRIGAPPGGSATGDFVDFPATTTILGAAKLTGRLPSKTSVGFLSAVTSGEHATTFNLASPARASVPVAPATVYAVGRVQQEFGANASTVALMFTGVHRDLRAGSPLASLLTRNAFTVSGDTLLRFKDGEYELSAATGATTVDGEAPAVARVQRNSAHFLQRPDNTYAPYSPLRTRLSGGHGSLSIARNGGVHWLWNASSNVESPEFEINDVGRLMAADGITLDAWLRYRETQPRGWLRSYSIQLERFDEWNFGGNRQNAQVSPQLKATWLNFWTTNVNAWFFGSTLDERLTRGGPLMRIRPARQGQIEVGSPESSQTQGGAGAYYLTRDGGDRVGYYYGSLSFRPSPRWQLTMKPTIVKEIDTRQYVATIDDGPVETYGKHYVFAKVDRATYSTQFRLNYTLKPDVTVDLYAEPFAASGQYGPTVELAAAGSSMLRPFLVPGNRDFNTRSFRSNAVLRWEWRPGSTLFVVWQQNRATIDPIGTRASLRDMFSSITVPGDHVFAIKTTFWISPN